MRSRCQTVPDLSPHQATIPTARCSSLFYHSLSSTFFVAKARTNGARAIVVTPLADAASYWNKLLRASVVQNDVGYLCICRQQASIGSDVAGKLAIFAVDFAPYASRSPTNAYPPGC